MNPYSPAWPHGDIKEIFSNIYCVTGTNITVHEGQTLQHSNNMMIVKHQDELTLINTLRLNENGLQALEKLGRVTNIVRLGAFHGRHDAFYLDRYSAKWWALKGIQLDEGKTPDIELRDKGVMPFPNCSLFTFETSKHPEGILHIHQEGGILITCDSVKNWCHPDTFFTPETIALYKKSGFFGEATLSTVWIEACGIEPEDFKRLKNLSFKHLLSAHGEPLLKVAYEKLIANIDNLDK